MAEQLNFNLYNSIILTGIIQGLIFSIVVASAKKYKSTTTLLLACFILSFSLDNLQYYFEDVGIITEEQFWGVYFIPFQLLSGPLFLLYGLNLIYPDRKLRKSDLLLFIPFTVALLVSSFYKIVAASGDQNSVSNYIFDLLEVLLEYTSIVLDVTILTYLFIKISYVEKRRAISKSLAMTPQLTWFKTVLLVLFILSGIWVVVTVFDYNYNTDYWYFVYIGMAAVIYWMGHIGIYKYGIDEERKQIRNYSIKNQSTVIVKKPKNEHIAAMEKLIVVDRKFLDATLTLDKIADELNISKSHLSRMIKTELGTSFPDYINSLRVQEAKIYLSNPEFSNYTLVAIGLEAGFNSKTTFNSTFKKVTGLTPSEFKNSL